MEATFKIENWPMSNPAAKQALGEIQTTHGVIPIPAYDMHGALIWPFHYWKYQENAVVFALLSGIGLLLESQQKF